MQEFHTPEQNLHITTALIPLVLVWLAVLVPQMVKDRRRRHREFLDSFAMQFGALDNPPPVPPEPQDDTGRRTGRGGPNAAGPGPARRRRKIFVGLLLSVAVSLLVVGVRPGKAALAVQLAVDDCLLAYVGLLVHWRDSRARQRRPVPSEERWPERRGETGDDEEQLVVLGRRRVRPALRAS